MYVLEDDFIVSLVVAKIESFSENGIGAFAFENFLSNLPIDLINVLPASAKHTLGYYFNSYSFEIYSNSFYECYSFVSNFETNYSFFCEEKND